MARRETIIDKLDQAPDESIEHYYRRLAKQADQRLVRLEAASHEKGFKKIKNWAYKKAIKDIEHWSGEGSMRFNTQPPKTMQQGEAKIDYAKLKQKIEDIKHFLQAPTSTKSGVIKTYKQRAESMNRTIPGAKFTWENLAKVFEPAGGGTSFSDLSDAGYDSAQILQVFSAIQQGNIKIKGKDQDEEARTNKMLADLIEKGSWDKIIEVEDEFVGDTVIEMLNNGDLRPEDIWGPDWKQVLQKSFRR